MGVEGVAESEPVVRDDDDGEGWEDGAGATHGLTASLSGVTDGRSGTLSARYANPRHKLAAPFGVCCPPRISTSDARRLMGRPCISLRQPHHHTSCVRSTFTTHPVAVLLLSRCTLVADNYTILTVTPARATL